MKSIALLALALCVVAVVLGEGGLSLHEVRVRDIDGKDTSLKAYRGQVLLLVNVASQCGYTPQYKALEAVFRKYQAKGFQVLGFPCNDFGAQEPGTNQEIKAFCSSTYDVSFPLFDKLHVKGPDQHPLYAALTGKDSPFPGEVKWNFSKFLIGRDGKIIQRYESKVAPDSPEVIAAIEAALAAR
jgi:glutathione peroxidase